MFSYDITSSDHFYKLTGLHIREDVLCWSIGVRQRSSLLNVLGGRCLLTAVCQLRIATGATATNVLRIALVLITISGIKRTHHVLVAYIEDKAILGRPMLNHRENMKVGAILAEYIDIRWTQWSFSLK